MNIYEHSLMSAFKFGDTPDIYIELHSFIDSSKLYIPTWRHRLLSHHTLFVGKAIEKFGILLPNNVLVRDVCFEHIKEDFGRVVTPYDWYNAIDSPLFSYVEFLNILSDTDFTNRIFNNILEKEVTSAQEFLESLRFKDKWMLKTCPKSRAWLKSEERFIFEEQLKNQKQ